MVVPSRSGSIKSFSAADNPQHTTSIGYHRQVYIWTRYIAVEIGYCACKPHLQARAQVQTSNRDNHHRPNRQHIHQRTPESQSTACGIAPLDHSVSEKPMPASYHNTAGTSTISVRYLSVSVGPTWIEKNNCIASAGQ